MTIPRTFYSDESVLQQELQQLFADRLFLGTEYDFRKIDSYSSFRIGQHALTCRSTPEGIRLFSNVCLHRNCLIDPEGNGQRAFRCPYHGWHYSGGGDLLQAPLTDLGCIADRKLQQFPVASSGGLIFATLAENLADLGEIESMLHHLDLEISAPFYQGELEHDCNWKLLVENVLEGYHLNFVHASSFLPAGISSSTPGTWWGGEYTSWLKAAPDPSPALAALKRFRGARHQYLHGYVFPALFLANTNNLIGFISELVPISAGKTVLRWQLFELPALRSLPDNVRETLRRDAVAFSHQVLNEDKSIVEACHAGLRSIGRNIQLQPNEDRIRHFHAMYLGAFSRSLPGSGSPFNTDPPPSPFRERSQPPD